jgi:hypothetical protein
LQLAGCAKKYASEIEEAEIRDFDSRYYLLRGQAGVPYNQGFNMVEVLTKFNPLAMVEPTTGQDYLALLNEAILLLDDLHDSLTQLTEELEKKNK